jgi:hypothetical protein
MTNRIRRRTRTSCSRLQNGGGGKRASFHETSSLRRVTPDLIEIHGLLVKQSRVLPHRLHPS